MASGSASGAVRIPGCLLETREVDGFLANCYRSAAILVHPCAHIEAAVLAWRHVLNGTVWGPAACEQLRDKSGIASAVAQLCSIIRLAMQPCSTAQNVSCSNNILAALQQELSCHVAQMHCSGTAKSAKGWEEDCICRQSALAQLVPSCRTAPTARKAGGLEQEDYGRMHVPPQRRVCLKSPAQLTLPCKHYAL